MRGRKLLALVVIAAPFVVAACGWDPKKPFERNAPAVDEAIGHLDAGRADAASEALQSYLGTGPCAEGSIGTPDGLRTKAQGTFDLGLALFRLGEAYGRRFGAEEVDAGSEGPEKALRRAQVDCALRVIALAAGSSDNDALLRAKAHYLEGNLHFLAGDYEDAVKAYDQAVVFEPGRVDAGDSVGRDAAWNRAIALRRIEEKKKQDAGPPDGGNDKGDSGPPSDGGNDKNADGGNDRGDGGTPPPDGGNDKNEDAGTPPPDQDGGAPPPEEPDAGPQAAPPPRAGADDRILDQLENAPTVQQEDAKRRAGKRRVRGMADK